MGQSYNYAASNHGSGPNDPEVDDVSSTRRGLSTSMFVGESVFPKAPTVRPPWNPPQPSSQEVVGALGILC